MIDIKNKKITVIGLGEKTGVSLVKYLVKGGAQVFVTEKKNKDEVMEAWDQVSNLGAEFEFGGHSLEKVLGSTMAVLCPGVPIDSPFVKEIKSNGMEVVSELEFAFKLLPKGKIIGVTGTNGKSTTVTMLKEIFQQWNKRTFVGGNLGNPLISALLDDAAYEFYVVEVSTFQLEAVKDFRPDVGILLNITPNHLDRHADMGEYTNLKLKMFTNQGKNNFAILNMDDPIVSKLEGEISAKKKYFSLNDDKADLFFDGKTVKGKEVNIEMGRMSLPGVHNAANFMASALAALSFGCPTEVLNNAVPKFNSLPHRIESVREFMGVKYFDDSKSTTVDSTAKAIESLKGTIVLIAGGRDKGTEYLPLRKFVERYARCIVLYGEAGEKMKKSLNGTTPVYICTGFDEAVLKAKELAKDGDSVLLSPANSSFDQFPNYRERGKKFQSIVKSFNNGS